MKTIIAGSRRLPTDHPPIYYVGEAMARAARPPLGGGIGLIPTEIVSGGARGVDLAGEMWAEEKGIPIKRFIPKWDLDGKAAGILRNIDMAHYADTLVAVWDGSSRGTKHMIEYAKTRGLKVYIHLVDF